MLSKSSAAMAAFGVALMLGAAPAALASGGEKTLYTFPNQYAGQPDAGVVADAAGNLYGSVGFGGKYNLGFIYELTPDSKGGWAYNTIYTFDGNAGQEPQGQLSFDAQGNLYGTTVGAGGMGTVFELSRDQSGTWGVSKTYWFTGEADGFDAQAGVVLDAAGNVYGTTMESDGYQGYGSIWKLTPSGNGWQETTIYQFGGDADGGYPQTGLTLDHKGNVYGSVQYGGTNNSGYVFRFHPTTRGWKKTVLHNFGDGDAGGTSYGELVVDKAGNIYGTTALYNHDEVLWNGSVFELTRPSNKKLPTQGNWPVSTLYQFNGTTGGFPYDLTFDKKGNIYGPDATGGANANGSIYELTPSENNGQTVWTESTLYNFTGGKDGCNPGPNIIFDKPVSGDLYGATTSCGANSYGTMFALKK